MQELILRDTIGPIGLSSRDSMIHSQAEVWGFLIARAHREISLPLFTHMLCVQDITFENCKYFQLDQPFEQIFFTNKRKNKFCPFVACQGPIKQLKNSRMWFTDKFCHCSAALATQADVSYGICSLVFCQIPVLLTFRTQHKSAHTVLFSSAAIWEVLYFIPNHLQQSSVMPIDVLAVSFLTYFKCFSGAAVKVVSGIKAVKQIINLISATKVAPSL